MWGQKLPSPTDKASCRQHRAGATAQAVMTMTETYRASILLVSSIVELTPALDAAVQLTTAMSHKPSTQTHTTFNNIHTHCH